MLANCITIFRVFLVFIAVYLLSFQYSQQAYIWALVYTILAFALDGLDGYVARKYNQTSKLGSVLDIMSDRIAEYTYWIIFATMGWIPAVFPIIVLTRGVVTDSLRSVAMEKGQTAFGENSMQTDAVCKFITGSKIMRISYAVAKVLAFVLLIVVHFPMLPSNIIFTLSPYVVCLVILAVILCVLRGIPVVLESKKLFVTGDKNEI